MRLSPELWEQWNRDGWLLLERAIAPPEIDATAKALVRLFPTAEEMAAEGRTAGRRGAETAGAPDGDGSSDDRLRPWQTWDARWPEFPFKSRSLNALVVHDTLIDLAQQLLGTPDIRLYEAILTAKYPGQSSGFNQLLHADYPNHTLVVPRRDVGYQHLETYIYLCDVSPLNGVTHLLSRSLTGDIGVERHSPHVGEYAALYEQDVAASGPAGTVVAYGPDVYHRSVDEMAEGQARFMLHVAYRPAEAQWIGFQSWPFKGLTAEWCDFAQGATPRQLEMVGFPPPGHPYWTEETLDGVQRRYPGLDMEAWRNAR